MSWAPGVVRASRRRCRGAKACGWRAYCRASSRTARSAVPWRARIFIVEGESAGGTRPHRPVTASTVRGSCWSASRRSDAAMQARAERMPPAWIIRCALLSLLPELHRDRGHSLECRIVSGTRGLPRSGPAGARAAACGVARARRRCTARAHVGAVSGQARAPVLPPGPRSSHAPAQACGSGMRTVSSIPRAHHPRITAEATAERKHYPVMERQAACSSTQ
jgi:DNA gyrase/topoisomerase IV subunit B